MLIEPKRVSHPEKEHIAYFSMEIGITHKLPTYSGGLGVLAGDTLKSFADLGLSVIAVTLLNEHGYFFQKIDNDGNQIEEPVNWRVDDFMVMLPNIITVRIEGREVKVRAWKYGVKGINGKINPVLYLDTNIEGNSDYDRTLTSHLYGGDRHYRLCQEIVLGIGGVRMLESLGYSNIKKYHMNEGHAGLLTVEIFKRHFHGDPLAIEEVKNKCVFTTHTPVAAGHDRFDISLFKQVLEDFVPDFMMEKARDGDKINMTLFGLNFSKYINGVAKRHGQVTKEMFPDYQIDSITNGIHALTWASEPFKKLFNDNIPQWSRDPSTLKYAVTLSREDVVNAHREAKMSLMDEVNQRTNLGFDVDRFTIGYARRFTEYKRPDLILYNVDRLKQMSEKVGEIQIIFAGKAHRNDTQGKELIKKAFHIARDINNQNCKVKIAFLSHYDMKLAKLMVSGCDVWLNTPQRPREASGTSGMKAALNGVPHFSTIDGWWLEGYIENVTGWAIGAHPHDKDFEFDNDPGKDADEMYNKLENVIIPTYYGDKSKWAQIMRYCIANNASFFNGHRMAQQYITHAYTD